MDAVLDFHVEERTAENKAQRMGTTAQSHYTAEMGTVLNL